MKKAWRYLLFYTTVLLISSTMVSCSDDEDGPGSSDDLVGTWEEVYSEGWEMYEGEKHSWSESENETCVKFAENGTFVLYDQDYETGKWKEEEIGTWSYKNGKIYINDEDGESRGNVLELTSTKLIIEIHEQPSTDEEYYSKETYKKISD